MEKSNIELTNEIYQNVQMGTHGIAKVIDKIDNKKLVNLLKKQDQKYSKVSTRCHNIATNKNFELKDINPLLKMSSSASIEMKTMFNDETSHIADMLIQGTTMGVTNVIKALGEYPSADTEIIALAEDLQRAEEEFVDSLKTFLTLTK